MTCGDLELDNEGHATIDLEVRPCTSPASSHAGPAGISQVGQWGRGREWRRHGETGTLEWEGEDASGHSPD